MGKKTHIKRRVQNYVGRIIIAYFDCNNADERRAYMQQCYEQPDFDSEAILAELKGKVDIARADWSKRLMKDAVDDLQECIENRGENAI